MKYLCLVYGEETTLDGMSVADMTRLVNDSLDCDAVLAESGHMIVAQALESVSAARTFRVRNGKLSLADGPFAETKEQLLGFVMIDAADPEEATQLASNIPMARVGSIEVRPIRELVRT